MEIYNLVNTYADKFIPIFIRVMVMLAFIPFIGTTSTPVAVRTGLGLALTLLLVPVVKVNLDDPLRAVFEAFFVGAALGLLVKIVLGAIETAGQWMSISMGIGVASVFNPQFGEVLGPLSLFYSLMGMGLFFILDIHYFFIEAIIRSFDITSVQYSSMFSAIMKLNLMFFPLAFKIAAPIFLVQVLVNLSMGFLSRAMPQANIFFISFPLLIGVGIIFMALTLGLTFMVMSKSFVHIKDAMIYLVR
ncbi:MAG TPA: flagellar biosynthetic protein FliR [Dissulfurispiraceae bacterium]|nr:flagellar biosynthetic protein FliR [Dissulfurispiraceae bacterium]